MNGSLTLSECDRFRFDADAADRPVRFIEKFCRHYAGEFVDTPFILHDVQREIVRDLFGWKYRTTGLRRFTDCYFEGAVGCGKSPLLAGLGLYGLIADNEAGAEVYSFASTFGQARVVFDCAKKFIGANTKLAAILQVTQFEIRHRASNSTWRIVSGKGPGAGCKPSLMLGDEVHDWPNAGAYDDLRDRSSKRRQPLMLCATNTPKTDTGFCAKLRAKAAAALAGAGDIGLYPVIWAAENEAETDDPAAWLAANPLLGITVSREKVAAKADEAMASEDPEDEPEFRRLYLGVKRTTAAGRWLDLAVWDACASTDAPPADAPLYVGLDLSESDDLCAEVDVYAVGTGRLLVTSHFWMPRITAERYARIAAVPYAAWAAEGWLTLLDTPTIDSAARKDIAAAVVARGKARIKAVCYDRFKADETVAALEAAGVTCVPIAQGYSVSPGCYELDRRLKESSLGIAPSPVLRFCAANAQVKQDDRGNIWPAKPGAKGRYAGTRGAKIDGISALVTVLTEARKHAFPVARKMWQGTMVSMKEEKK